jgi:hypothetical protein
MKILLSIASALIVLAAIPLLRAQDLPDGKGKDLVTSKCAECHGLEQVAAHRDTREGWAGVVDYMISRGMSVNEDEAKTILDYLATAFPPATKK